MTMRIKQPTYLFSDVLEGVFEPVVEGDVSLPILINGLEVFLALGDTSL